MRSESKVDDIAIEDFLAPLAAGWTAVDLDAVVGGLSNFTADPLMARPWTTLHTLPMIRKTKELGISPSEISILLHSNTSVIRCLMQFDLFMAKVARSGIPTYLEIFDFYHHALMVLCPEDPFAKNLTNRIHTDDKIQKIASQCADADPEVARILGRMANACLNLSYALYSDMNPQLGYDNFGPYDYHGDLFAVKIFPNLRPVELWPETAELPAGGVEVHAVLENVSMTVDCVTHAIYTGDQINGLRKWRCLIDGKEASISNIKELTAKVQEMAIAIFKKVKTYDTAKLKENYSYQKAWGYKKLFDRLGLDWNPQKEALESMRGQELFGGFNIPAENTDAFFRDCFDPRAEISRQF